MAAQTTKRQNAVIFTHRECKVWVDMIESENGEITFLACTKDLQDHEAPTLQQARKSAKQMVDDYLGLPDQQNFYPRV